MPKKQILTQRQYREVLDQGYSSKAKLKNRERELRRMLKLNDKRIEKVQQKTLREQEELYLITELMLGKE